MRGGVGSIGSRSMPAAGKKVARVDRRGARVRGSDGMEARARGRTFARTVRNLAHALIFFFACACGGRAPDAVVRDDPERAGPGGASSNDAAAGVVAADAPLVVFLGDSITAGLHLARDEAFPARVAAKLAAEGAPIRAVNAGVSGDTSAGGLRRLDWVLAQRPAVLVVELGANDGLRGLPIDAIEENLATLVARARESGAKVLLLGMQLPPSYGKAYADAFTGLFERVASATGAAFVPLFLDGVGGVPDQNLEDGLHPNARGHERLAENVAPHLAKLLR